MKHHPNDVKEQMRALIRENVEGISILNIYIEENQIKVQAKKPKKQNFMQFIIQDNPDIEVIYTAYLDNNKWKIVKERG